MDDHRLRTVDAATVEARIAKREAEEKQVWITTVFGVLGAVAGLVFAFVALLKFENTTAAFLGFGLFGISAGIVTPSQVTKFVASKIPGGS